ncbi:MAG: CYTH domain-containing protein [Alkalibacterium sp.]|nr:CYTH domain-containing protein [Alkalibacterium sp.]
MNQEIEIEFKNLLTEEEYDVLSSTYFLKSAESFTQKNIYYDTESYDLKNRSCALRIRVKEESAEFTLKSPFEGHHKELNIPLTIEEAERLISMEAIMPPEQIKAFLKNEYELDVTTVNKLTELVTQRIEKEYKECLLVLDKSWYNDTVDYELEIESPSIEQGSSLFDSLLRTHSIPKRHTPNKIARAHRALHRRK